MTRALLTFVAGVAVAAGGFAPTQSGHDHGKKGPAVKVLSAVDVDEKLDGKPTRATTLEVTFEPSASSAPHRHPGPVFGTVLEGELDFQAGDAPLFTRGTRRNWSSPSRRRGPSSRQTFTPPATTPGTRRSCSARSPRS